MAGIRARRWLFGIAEVTATILLMEQWYIIDLLQAKCDVKSTLTERPELGKLPVMEPAIRPGSRRIVVSEDSSTS